MELMLILTIKNTAIQVNYRLLMSNAREVSNLSKPMENIEPVYGGSHDVLHIYSFDTNPQRL